MSQERFLLYRISAIPVKLDNWLYLFKTKTLTSVNVTVVSIPRLLIKGDVTIACVLLTMKTVLKEKQSNSRLKYKNMHW